MGESVRGDVQGGREEHEGEPVAHPEVVGAELEHDRDHTRLGINPVAALPARRKPSRFVGRLWISQGRHASGASTGSEAAGSLKYP